MFVFLAKINDPIMRIIRLFSGFWSLFSACVISLILVKKVLTNHDIICYNVQAVRERGANPEPRQAPETGQANLENDTEKKSTKCENEVFAVGKADRFERIKRFGQIA